MIGTLRKEKTYVPFKGPLLTSCWLCCLHLTEGGREGGREGGSIRRQAGWPPSDWIGQQHLKNPREKEGKREREGEGATRKEGGGKEEGPASAPGTAAKKRGWKRPKWYRGTIGKSLYLGDPLRNDALLLSYPLGIYDVI